MAFANLFTSLSAVEDDVKCPDVQLASKCRNETGKSNRGTSRKGKSRGEQTGPCSKRQCYQAGKTRTNRVTGYNFNTFHHHNHNTESGRASVDITKHVTCNRKDKGGNSNMCLKDQSYQTKNKSKGNKQKVRKNKKDEEKNQEERGRPACRGRAHQTRFMSKGGDRKHNNWENPPRFMTQEFKDQNALEVEGQLLCRHFLCGKCIKGDDCQLKHVQVYNGLIKEMCKFYVNGFCMKGESCPYMHKSFPCKFFHRGGRCFDEAGCRFSHDPLTDETSKLLDEAIKRANELKELAKAAEQEPVGPPVDREPSDTLDTDKMPDLFLQPLRPNFYKSTDNNTEEESPFSVTEEPVNVVSEAVKPHVLDCVEPHSPPSTNLEPAEPVCYSVQAVLGPQLLRPFTSSFTFPKSKEFVPLSSSCISDSTNQTQAPYSVDAVLKSFKSAESSTSGHIITLYTQTVSCTPEKSGDEEVAGPLQGLDTENKVSCLINTVKEEDRLQEKETKGLNSKNCTKPPQALRDHRRQHRDSLISPNSSQRATYDVKLDVLSKDIKCSPNLTSESVDVLEHSKQRSMVSSPQTETSSSKHPALSKPKLSLLTADSHTSSKPFCPTGSKQSISIMSSESPPTVTCHFNSKRGPKNRNGAETRAECSSQMTQCGGLAVGCKRTPKRPFRSLFTTPLRDSLQLACPSSPQNPAHLSCPALKSTDCKSEHPKTCERDKAAARSSVCLSAAPFSAASLAQSDDNSSRSLESQKSASNRKAPLSQQGRAEENSNSSDISPNPKTGKISQPTEQHVDPAGSAARRDCLSPSTTQKQLAHVTSHREAAPANSVLKTLFLSLGPYQQDRIQNSVPSEWEKDKSNTPSVHGKQQRRSRKKSRQRRSRQSRQNQMETQDAHEQSPGKTAAHHGDQHPAHRTSEVSAEATGWPTLSSPGKTEGQVRDAGTHKSPLRSDKPAVPPMLHHVQPRLKHTSASGACVNTTVGATPFRNLFSTFDTSVSHTGH